MSHLPIIREGTYLLALALLLNCSGHVIIEVSKTLVNATKFFTNIFCIVLEIYIHTDYSSKLCMYVCEVAIGAVKQLHAVLTC